MNPTALKRYMKALVDAYAIAKKLDKIDGYDFSIDMQALQDMWDDASMKLTQNGGVDDYEWVKSQANLIDVTHWK